MAKLHYTCQTLSERDFATFLMTQVTFGTMSSALSVLGITFVLTRWLLPALIREDPIPGPAYLDPMGRQVQRMVHWLAFVPQISLLAVAVLIAGRSDTLLVMLGIVSGLMYGLGILFARSIRRSVAWLRTLLAPSDGSLNGVQY
jgi:hypothetical protein